MRNTLTATHKAGETAFSQGEYRRAAAYLHASLRAARALGRLGHVPPWNEGERV